MARYTYTPNRVIDTNGISDGASIFFFQTGTTAPISIFSDAGLTTPLPNPVVVNAGAAVPPVYYAGSAARVRVVNSSGTIVSDDNPYPQQITAPELADPNISSVIGISRPGVSTNPANLQQRLNELFERSFENIAPAYIETLSTGLLPNTPANVSATLAVNVTGTAGSAVLTTPDTGLVAGFGSTSIQFEAALVSNDGRQRFFATVIANNGSTQITLRRPLAANFTGALSPKYDATLGQHLSENGTRAYAQHVADQAGLFCARGRILDGAWLGGPSNLQNLWQRNAALVSYGIINSAAPIVQTSLLNNPSPYNVVGLSGVVGPTSLANRGITVGTHTTGHGVTASLFGRGKDVVLEFWVGADRPTTTLTGTSITVSVQDEGVEIYSATVGSYMTLHRVPIMAAGKIDVFVTNADGGIYNIHISQTTLREAGLDGRLIRPNQKVVCLGDSWFEFYSGLFATTLANITGATVVNRGLGGQTTEWALSWFDTYVAAERPDVCIFHFGINDSNDLSGQTFTTPTGGTLPKWPAGLTEAQAQARWRGNLEILARRCQALGIRPVFINIGGTASIAQTQKHVNWSWQIDRSAPVDWVATEAQFADSTSFVNNFGKRRGAVVSTGEAVKYATGSLPTSPWSNPIEAGVLALQRKTLKRSDYDRTPSFTLGTDSNTDGISDGLVQLSYGTINTAGESLAFSIASGAQRFTHAFVAGNTGNARLRWDFSLEAAKDYFFVFEVANASAAFAMDVVENISTGSFVVPAADAGSWSVPAGTGVMWARLVANGTATNRGVLFAPTRLNGSTRTMDVTSAYCIDLALLFADAPNAATLSNADLAAFIRGILP